MTSASRLSRDPPRLSVIAGGFGKRLLEAAKRVFQAGDGPERRDGDGQIDLLGHAGKLEQGLVVAIVTSA